MTVIELSTLSDASFEEDSPFSIAIAPFPDFPTATYAYTVTLADGTALPEWLAFDAVALTLAGVPPQDFNGALSISVTASDGSVSAVDTFDLGITPVNDAPVVVDAPAAVAAKEDAAFSTTIDMAAIFADADGDALAYGVSNLPGWLQYDAQTSTLSGTPWPDTDAVVNVTLSATDASGASAETTLAIDVSENPGITIDASKAKSEQPIVGSDGQDNLTGGIKDDTIAAGAGSDTITGGLGKDIITTGTGWDTVVFSAGSGKDVVTDFQLGIDRLVLGTGISSYAITEVDTNKDKIVDSTLVTFDTKDSVQLTGLVGVADPGALLIAEWMA